MKNNYPFIKTCVMMLSFIAFSSIGFSQAANWLWDENFGGPQSDFVNAMSRDAAGNIYITGNMASPSFNFGSFTVTDTFAQTFFITKLNAQGNVVWAKTGGGYGGNAAFNPGPTGIVNDASGNIYVAGAFESDTFVIGSYTLVKTDTGGYGKTVFVAEYDPSGNVLWAESLGGSTSAYCTGIALDANNNAYITGYFSTDSMTIGNNVLISNNTGHYDAFTAKLSPTGQVMWAKNATGPQVGVVSYAIATSADGGVYITGTVQSDTAIFGSYTLTNPLYAYLIFITKYDTLGNVLWAITEGDSSYQYGYGITTDAAFNVYLTGSFVGRTLHLGNAVLANDSFGDGGDIYLAKFDPNGNVIWARHEGGKANDLGLSVAVGNSGDLYLSGYFWSRPFVIGQDTFNVAGSNGSAVFVAKYDTAGNEQWAKFGYSYENVTIAGLAPDGLGNAYIAGYFVGTYMMFDSSELINAGNTGVTTDMFVAKAGTGVTGVQINIDPEDILTVFPNPSADQVTIAGLLQPATIYLYDMEGRLLFKQETGSTWIRMDLSNLAAGLYMLQTPVGSRKIVKL